MTQSASTGGKRTTKTFHELREGQRTDEQMVQVKMKVPGATLRQTQHKHLSEVTNVCS